MNLDFGQCLILLVIILLFGLILCRALIGVANRFVFAVSEAKKLMGGKGAGRGGIMGLVELFGPEIKNWLTGQLRGGGGQP